MYFRDIFFFLVGWVAELRPYFESDALDYSSKVGLNMLFKKKKCMKKSDFDSGTQ